MKNILILFIATILLGCDSKIRDIYDVYPKGRQILKEDLKYMKAIYVIDNDIFAIKVDLADIRHIDYYMPHILFFDNTLSLYSASYFPFSVDSLKETTFYCKYTDRDWAKRKEDFRNDIPSYITISSSYLEHSSGNFDFDLVLDDISLDEFPIISFIINNGSNIDTLRAPCDRFEFTLWEKANPDGIRGIIYIKHKDQVFPRQYKNNAETQIKIYENKIIDKFYNELWSKLQERRR